MHHEQRNSGRIQNYTGNNIDYGRSANFNVRYGGEMEGSGGVRGQYHQNEVASQRRSNDGRAPPQSARYNAGAQPPSLGRSSLNDTPVRMLVNARYVGALIGQGGCNIRQISKDSKARIDVTRSIRASVGSLVEKIVNVYGTPENCSTACVKIFDLVWNEARKDQLNQGRNIEPELKLLAYNNFIGRLIGKNGSVIKKIMEETSCAIVFSSFNDMNAFTMERTITIRGDSVEKISLAESRISAKLRTCWDADFNNSIYSMYGAGPHPLTFGPNPPHMGGVGASYGGPIAAYPFASVVAAPPPQQAGQAPSFVQRCSVAPPPASGGDSAYGDEGSMGLVGNQTARSVVYIWVPSASVGALIGTKGTNIRQIIRLTGAQVRIESPKPVRGQPQQETDGSNGLHQAQQPSHQNSAQTVAVQPQQQATPQALDDSSASTENKHPGKRRVLITGSDSQQYKCQLWVFQRICEQMFTYFDDVHLCAEFLVPSGIVGRIIGKKGQNVRELQRCTGAQVKILEEQPADDQTESVTLIRVTGNFNASQAVQNRIRYLVRQFDVQQKTAPRHTDDAVAPPTSSTTNGAGVGVSDDRSQSSMEGDRSPATFVAGGNTTVVSSNTPSTVLKAVSVSANGTVASMTSSVRQAAH